MYKKKVQNVPKYHYKFRYKFKYIILDDKASFLTFICGAYKWLALKFQMLNIILFNIL